jgi:tRNA modification GTPase
VSDIAGTTRDTIEEKFNLGGHSFRLIDTAGIRESEDTIEKIGIERTFKSIQEASIVLYLFDATDIEIDELNSDLQRISGDKHCIILSNKEDKNGPKTEHPQAIKLSAKNNTGIDQLINALKAAAFDIVSSESNTIVSNMRHVEALKHALSDLERVKEGLKTNITGDFIAMDIRSSLHHLGSITGEITPDDLLGNIFGRFCIGK